MEDVEFAEETFQIERRTGDIGVLRRTCRVPGDRCGADQVDIRRSDRFHRVLSRHIVLFSGVVHSSRRVLI